MRRVTESNVRTVTGIAVMVVSASFFGCSSSDSGAQPQTQTPGGTVLQSSLTRDTLPNVPSIDAAELVAGNNAFAWDMYTQLRSSETGNIFYSPFSISLALAMTYAGARTETAQEMATALHFTLGQDRLHPALNSLDLALMSRGKGAQGREGEGFILRIANSVWGEQTYSFLPSYLDVIALNYGAGMRLVDFMHQPEPCRVTINGWVSDETNDKIPELIPQGAIDPGTTLVLVNAVYFDAMWADTFEQKATSPQAFYIGGGDSVTSQFMRRTGTIRHGSGANYEAVELPYDGGEISMVLVLPAPGALGSLESAMSPAFADAIVAGMTDKNVRLSLPKFTFRFGTKSLVDAFTALGMTHAFGDADFSGIDGTRNLAISDILHQAFVAVDEKGTTAAAATAVIIQKSSGPLSPDVVMTLDRPFLFFIRDVGTGQVLFVGRVMVPEQT